MYLGRGVKNNNMKKCKIQKRWKSNICQHTFGGDGDGVLDFDRRPTMPPSALPKEDVWAQESARGELEFGLGEDAVEFDAVDFELNWLIYGVNDEIDTGDVFILFVILGTVALTLTVSPVSNRVVEACSVAGTSSVAETREEAMEEAMGGQCHSKTMMSGKTYEEIKYASRMYLFDRKRR